MARLGRSSKRRSASCASRTELALKKPTYMIRTMVAVAERFFLYGKKKAIDITDVMKLTLKEAQANGVYFAVRGAEARVRSALETLEWNQYIDWFEDETSFLVTDGFQVIIITAREHALTIEKATHDNFYSYFCGSLKLMTTPPPGRTKTQLIPIGRLANRIMYNASSTDTNSGPSQAPIDTGMQDTEMPPARPETNPCFVSPIRTAISGRQAYPTPESAPRRQASFAGPPPSPTPSSRHAPSRTGSLLLRNPSLAGVGTGGLGIEPTMNEIQPARYSDAGSLTDSYDSEELVKLRQEFNAYQAKAASDLAEATARCQQLDQQHSSLQQEFSSVRNQLSQEIVGLRQTCTEKARSLDELQQLLDRTVATSEAQAIESARLIEKYEEDIRNVTETADDAAVARFLLYQGNINLLMSETIEIQRMKDGLADLRAHAARLEKENKKLRSGLQVAIASQLQTAERLQTLMMVEE